MGPFWKKMLRLSSARSKGLTRGAEFNASEVRPAFSKVVEHSQGGDVFASVFLTFDFVCSKSSEQILVTFSGNVNTGVYI